MTQKIRVGRVGRRHLPGKSAHLQTVTGHFSNTDLRDVVDKCCRYELQRTQNKKIRARTLLLAIKLMFKKMMLLLSNFDGILMEFL